jgi:hypothetical protein
LLSPTGDNLLNNGDFSRGLDRWNFTSDEHLAWHVKQIGLAVLFDLGVFGLVVMGVLTILAVWRAARDAWRGGMAQAASLAALSAFIAVGLFDSLVDAPRFLFLFLTVCWLALTVAAPQQNIGNKSTPARS